MVRGADGRFTFHIELRDRELRFVSDSSGKQPSPGSGALSKLGIFYVNVRGWKHYPAARVKMRSRVELRREPDNEYDRNAIAVARVGANSIYGYINKGVAARIARYIDAGDEFVAIAMGRSGITLAIMRITVADELGLNSD
nr:HIRAN domain-containing protein [Brevibacterium antiquum]